MKEEKIIKNNIMLHKLLTNELMDNHSIGAFMELISMGREVEMEVNEQSISVTHLNGKVLLSYDSFTQSFDNVWEVIVKGIVDNQYFISIWDEIKIKVLF